MKRRIPLACAPLSVRLARRPAWLLAALLLMLCALPAPPAHGASTVSVSNSVDPTEEESVTLSVTGSTDASRRLYVLYRASTYACAGNAYYESNQGGVGLTGNYGDPIGVGSFSKTFRFTPASSGTYRICAYVAASSTDAPAATTTHDVAVREPFASFEPVVVSADPTEEEAVGFTLSGTTEAARRLYVFYRASRYDCAGTAYSERNQSGIELTGHYGEPIGPGSFSKPLTFTPANSGTYRICAYVAETDTDTPVATQSHDVALREPGASLEIVVSPNPFDPGHQLSVSVSGATEANRALYVFYRSSTHGCASNPYYERNQSGKELTAGYNGEAITAGAFSKTFSFMAADSTSYEICAYVGETTTDTPQAVGSAVATKRVVSAAPGAGSAPRPSDDSARIPANLGRLGEGEFWVSTRDIGRGLSVGRLESVAKRAGERWGFTYRGRTAAAAGARDGLTVVGFTPRISPSMGGALLQLRSGQLTDAGERCVTRRVRRGSKPLARRKPAGKRRLCHREQTLVGGHVVQRDVGLAATASWQGGPARPSKSQLDLETVLLHGFGHLAGNMKHAPACANSPLAAHGRSFAGRYWRSASVWRPRTCDSR